MFDRTDDCFEQRVADANHAARVADPFGLRPIRTRFAIACRWFVRSRPASWPGDEPPAASAYMSWRYSGLRGANSYYLGYGHRSTSTGRRLQAGPVCRGTNIQNLFDNDDELAFTYPTR
jgi:hypothetical protein